MLFRSIDESYDLIFDDNQRYAAAFEQVKKLCSMPQQEVYEAIKDTVEHNFNIVMSRNWTHYSTDKITEIVNR